MCVNVYVSMGIVVQFTKFYSILFFGRTAFRRNGMDPIHVPFGS